MKLRIAAALAGVMAVLVVALIAMPRPAAPSAPPIASPSTSAPTVVPSPVATGSPAPAARGSISGKLAYPSDFIPPLTVYAISTTDSRQWFSVDTPRYPLPGTTPPEPTYTISGVAPGTYHVLAYANDQAPLSETRPGVYSAAVPCGLHAGCTDHSLLPVTVAAEQRRAGIDVTDWYYPIGTTYPPRPR